MKRGKRMRKAYLKHIARSYDPLSPYALRSRGARAIDLGSVPPPTVTHGKRGLTMARATGPTAVIKDAFTDDVENQRLRGAQKSTMIPRAAVLLKLEQTKFYSKYREYYRQPLPHREGHILELWFSGLEFIFVKEVEGTQYRSAVYTKDEATPLKLNTSRICWVEIISQVVKVPSG